MFIKAFRIGKYKFILSRDEDGWQVTNQMEQVFSINFGYVTCKEKEYLIHRFISFKYELAWCKIE